MFIIIAMITLCVDYLSLATDVEAKEEEIGPSNCLCNGPSCICCIEFNMSYMDLGGPGMYTET